MNSATLPIAPAPARGSAAWLRRAFAPIWLIVAVCAVVDLALHVPLLQAEPYYTMAHEAAAQLAETMSGREALGLVLAALSLACSAVFIGAGAVVFWRRRSDPMALLAALALLTAPVVVYFGGLDQPFHWHNAYGLEWGGRLAAFNTGLRTLGFVLFLALLYLFPDGRLRPRWAGAGFGIGLAAIAVVTLSNWEWGARLLSVLPAAYWLFVAVPLIASIVVGALGQLWRYRHAGAPLEQQQIRWVTVAFALFAIGFVFTALAEPIFGGTAVENLIALINLLAHDLSALFIPLALTASVARYRLWGAEPLMRRAVVYAAVTAFVVGAYALIVGGVGAMTGAPGMSPFLALLATGVVAVAFSPVRDGLQRVANRALFGQRDEPYAVLSQLGQRLEATLAPETALQTIAQTIGQALKLPFAEIEVMGNDGEGLRYRYVTDAASADAAHLPADAQAFALTYQNEPLGALRIAPRPGERLSDKDARLLTDLARQAGVAIHAAQVTLDLRRSRERIVSAREEERRRLHRDLHDGFGPTLASHTLKLDAAIDLIEAGPQQARAVLEDLKRQTQAMVGDLRRLVNDLRPPALDDMGLAGALRSVYGAPRVAPPRVLIHAIEPLPPLPAAAEVAAFRIVGEAVANALRHAQAQQCDVRLTVDNEFLRIVVEDDGKGIDVDNEAAAGVGLRSMRERAEELGGTFEASPRPGGGTRIAAALPIIG